MIVHNAELEKIINIKQAVIVKMWISACFLPGKNAAMYFARESKGHEGVMGAPEESYGGILIHDHDKTYYSYGSDHQKCMVYILRYLKGSMENEPDSTWNREMQGLIQKMIHAAHCCCMGLKVSGSAPCALRK